jgi:integral membrane protein
MENSPANQNIVKGFLVSGFVEGWSYILLFFVAMPLKYLADMPQYVRIVGMIHGVLVLVYVLYLVLMHVKVKLSLKKTGIAFLLSLVPFGTFFLRRLL